jgi:hypothetical protein
MLTGSGGWQLYSKTATTNNGRRRGGVALGRRWRGRRLASVALGRDLRTGKSSSEQRGRPTWSNPCGSAANLPARMTATGLRGDVDCGGEVAALDRPRRQGWCMALGV